MDTGIHKKGRTGHRTQVQTPLNTHTRAHAQKEKKKMIHRKWSLLTMPAAVLGGIVAAVVAANFIFVENDPFLKPKQGKQDKVSSTK